VRGWSLTSAIRLRRSWLTSEQASLSEGGMRMVVKDGWPGASKGDHVEFD